MYLQRWRGRIALHGPYWYKFELSAKRLRERERERETLDIIVPIYGHILPAWPVRLVN